MMMGGPAAGRAMQEQMIMQDQPQPPGAPPGGPAHGPRPPHPMAMGGPGAPPPPGGPMSGREMDGEAMMHHPHPPKGAMFVFREGDQHVMIKCADDEPTQVCVTAAVVLMDRLAANGGGQAQGAPGVPPQQ